MSASGTYRTLILQESMSAFMRKADVVDSGSDVRALPAMNEVVLSENSIQPRIPIVRQSHRIVLSENSIRPGFSGL